jgi:hypothetical protein
MDPQREHSQTIQRRDLSENPTTLGSITRRDFGRGTGRLLLGGAIITPAARRVEGGDATLESADRSNLEACDFQRSFMTWDFPYREDPRPYARHNIPHGNMARIQLDALIDVVDRDTGQSERFVLIAPCRAEWVYAEDRLFQLPSREYRNIYSLTEQRAMGASLTHDGTVSRGRPVSEDFRSLRIEVRSYPRVRLLQSPAEIVEATGGNLPLIGRTKITDHAGKYSYLLEYPIKTMNFQPKTNSFQVDTGPLLAPDYNVEVDRTIDRLELAYVAYNRLDLAEFIFRRPTPVENEAGKTLCQVLQYSEVREDRATNQILAGLNDTA